VRLDGTKVVYVWQMHGRCTVPSLVCGLLPLPLVCTWKNTEIDRREIGCDRTGWIYLARVGNGGVLLCVQLRTFGFHKSWRILLAEREPALASWGRAISCSFRDSFKAI
jgi:hypothetical protein